MKKDIIEAFAKKLRNHQDPSWADKRVSYIDDFVLDDEETGASHDETINVYELPTMTSRRLVSGWANQSTRILMVVQYASTQTKMRLNVEFGKK